MFPIFSRLHVAKSLVSWRKQIFTNIIKVVFGKSGSHHRLTRGRTTQEGRIYLCLLTMYGLGGPLPACLVCSYTDGQVVQYTAARAWRVRVRRLNVRRRGVLSVLRVIYVVRSNRNRKVWFTRLGWVGRVCIRRYKIIRKPFWITFVVISPFSGISKTGKFNCKSPCLLDPLLVWRWQECMILLWTLPKLEKSSRKWKKWWKLSMGTWGSR